MSHRRGGGPARWLVVFAGIVMSACASSAAPASTQLTPLTSATTTPTVTAAAASSSSVGSTTSPSTTTAAATTTTTRPTTTPYVVPVEPGVHISYAHSPPRLPGLGHLRHDGLRHDAGVTGQRTHPRGAPHRRLGSADEQPGDARRPVRRHPRRRRRALLPRPPPGDRRRDRTGRRGHRRPARSASSAAPETPAPATSTSASPRRAPAWSGRCAVAWSGRGRTSTHGARASSSARGWRSTAGRWTTPMPARRPKPIRTPRWRGDFLTWPSGERWVASRRGDVGGRDQRGPLGGADVPPGRAVGPRGARGSVAPRADHADGRLRDRLRVVAARQGPADRPHLRRPVRRHLPRLRVHRTAAPRVEAAGHRQRPVRGDVVRLRAHPGRGGCARLPGAGRGDAQHRPPDVLRSTIRTSCSSSTSGASRCGGGTSSRRASTTATSSSR